jgi:hypothetical protein
MVTSSSITEMILRDQKNLSALIQDEHRSMPTITRLLIISIAGLSVHGLVLGAVTEILGIGPSSELGFMSGGHPVLWMAPVFVAAFMGALSICLPSFYFYTQLSGLDASFRVVTAQALRAQATTSVLLLGALPVYVAIALASVLHVMVSADQAITIGIALPFLIGLFGVRAVQNGFRDLLTSLPITHARRGNFVGRMVLAWGAVYTAIAPIALYRLAESLSKLV